jgi:hypothetical protein
MRRKFLSHFFGILIGLLLITQLLPSHIISAQSQDEDPDFIITLALMAVADDRLDGVMDLSALSNLRAEVGDYYDQKSYLHMDDDTAAAFSAEKKVVLDALEKKINIRQNDDAVARIGLFIAMADSTNDAYRKDDGTYADPFEIYQAVTSVNYKPDPAAMALLQQRLSASTTNVLKNNLNDSLAANVDQGAELVRLSSDAVYDFEAGKGNTVEVQYRPLNFVNAGSKTIRVSIEYYQPVHGLSVSVPPLDVELPGDTNVILDGFPQGNYVFCYDWQTDIDANGDGVKDYDRAVSHAWVSPGHPQDPGFAHDVFLYAGFSPTPIGRCDGFKGEAPSTELAMSEEGMTEDDPGPVVVEPTEYDVDSTDYAPPDDSSGDNGDSLGADFWDQDGSSTDDDSGQTLSYGEQANQGGHAYAVVCYAEGEMSDTTYIHANWNFTEGGVTLDGSDFYTRISANVYKNSEGHEIIFSTTGFHSESFYYSETTSEGVTTTVTRTCTATIED